jgi:hypothetical protein
MVSRVTYGPVKQVVCAMIDEDDLIYSSQRMFWKKME